MFINDHINTGKKGLTTEVTVRNFKTYFLKKCYKKMYAVI